MERQLSKSRQSVDDLVPKTDLSRAQLYLWKRSEQTSISEEQLAALAPALSDDPIDHAALLRAHLMDEAHGPGCELLRIEIDQPDAVNDRPRPRSKGEKALAFLANERLRNRDLNDLLIDLARVLGGFDERSNSDPRVAAAEARIVEIVENEASAKQNSPSKPSK